MPRKSKKKGRVAPKKPSILLRLLVGLLLLVCLAFITAIFFNPFVWRLDLRAELNRSRLASTIYDRDGAEIVTLYSKTRLWAPLGQIPRSLTDAFIATEDYRFYQHKGIDVRGIGRALVRDIMEGHKLQGGSTITQQLVKNLFLSQEKNIFRKVWEMAYAIRIEQQYTKAQILEFYLNSIYLGHGSWGVQAASQVYFGKQVQRLNTSEAALIAGLAKGPEYYSPYRNPEGAKARRNLVLKLMGLRGYLKGDVIRRLSQEPIRTLKEPGTTYVGAYFSDYVIHELKRQTHDSESYLRSSGLKIYTTMDRNIQAQTEKAMNILPVEGPDRWKVTQPQGAIVVLDPTTGQILGIVGGRHFSTAEPNRAYQILRQPGSAIKPFVYATAIESGYKPDQEMVDQPLTISVNGETWRPQNYDNKYRGTITLRTALEESVNTIAVQLVQRLGPAAVFQVARRMGLTSLVPSGDLNDQGLAPLALGGLTKGVTLLELTGTYSSFANGGVLSVPYGITRVYDRAGRLIYSGRMAQHQVIQAQTADSLTSMMEGVITRGTGIRASIGISAAGKTGTTNQNTNGWFIGYTGDLLAGVWIGNDEQNKPLIAGGAAMGSGMASAIWGELMRKVASKGASLHAYSPGK